MTTKQNPVTGWHILVIDNGFVFVGDVLTQNGMLLVQHAKQLRKWGTTAGLGEITGGPTKQTAADPVGVLLIPYARLVFALPASEKGWKF